MLPLSSPGNVYVAGSNKLKLSLVGSGARGTGAVVDALRTDTVVELVLCPMI